MYETLVPRGRFALVLTSVEPCVLYSEGNGLLDYAS